MYIHTYKDRGICGSIYRRESTFYVLDIYTMRHHVYSTVRHNHLTNVMNDKYNFLPPQKRNSILRCVYFAFGYMWSTLYRKNPSHIYIYIKYCDVVRNQYICTPCHVWHIQNKGHWLYVQIFNISW